MTMASQAVKKLAPKHIEYMRHLCMGESQHDIAEMYGINEGRLSIIINSPLFQLELRRMQRRMEDQIASIHQRLVEGASKAVDLHTQIVEGHIKITDPEDGKDLLVPVPLANRQASASALSNLFVKLTKGSALDTDDEDDTESYESKLERAVTVTETRTIKHRKPKDGEVVDTTEAMLLEQEEDVLDAIEVTG